MSVEAFIINHTNRLIIGDCNIEIYTDIDGNRLLVLSGKSIYINTFRVYVIDL